VVVVTVVAVVVDSVVEVIAPVVESVVTAEVCVSVYVVDDSSVSIVVKESDDMVVKGKTQAAKPKESMDAIKSADIFLIISSSSFYAVCHHYNGKSRKNKE